MLSDRAAEGSRADGCLPVLREHLGAAYEIVRENVMPDEPAQLQAALIDICDSEAADLILTSGGTGLGPRDRTPQATAAVLDYAVPGVAEAIRAASIPNVRTAMLSRACCGVRGRTLILNLPGSPRAAGESLDAVIDVLPHALELLRGQTDHGA